VARTQLRALVEEKENTNTYLSEHLVFFGLYSRVTDPYSFGSRSGSRGFDD
jgi:hypothetical protein